MTHVPPAGLGSPGVPDSPAQPALPGGVNPSGGAGSAAAAVAVKAAVAEGYRRVAPGWEAWREEFRVAGAEVTAALLHAARVRPTDRVLDVACGAGEPALTLAPLARSVTAVDLVPEMVRAVRRADPRLPVAVADAEALPFADGVFDLVTCRAAVLHLPDPARAAAGFARVLRPGGRVALSALGPAADTPAVAATVAVLARHGARSPRLPALPDPYRFGEAGALTGLLAGAGFVEVAERQLVAASPWPGDAEQFWVALPQHGWWVAALLDSLPPAALASARAESLALLRHHERDGVLHLSAPVAVATGVRR
jgi:SAM-dependent methyltransferase